MANILTSLQNTVIAGVVLTVIMVAAVGGAMGMPAFDHAWFAFFFRWLHVLSGVMWIGLLWYFNFVQIPNMPNIPDEQKPAIGKVIAPAALWWFRWGAMSTIVTGLILAWMNGYIVDAIAIGLTNGVGKHMAIGIGMWLGAMLIGFGIYAMLAIPFRSYIQPMVIMITIPFGIIGAIAAHLVLGYDLFMFSIFGMVALTGVVVNDAIVLIEAVNHRIAKGMPIFQAITEGGVRRFRAIMLTSISTIGGLLPLILEKDAQAQIVIPMALSIAGGVAFATVLTLIFIPCCLGVLNDLRRLLHLTIRADWPTRERVEPARKRYVDPFEQPADDAEPKSEPVVVK